MKEKMTLQIPNVGKIEVEPNNTDGYPAFFIKFNDTTIAHVQMDLQQENVDVIVWPKETFEHVDDENKFEVFTYPAFFKG